MSACLTHPRNVSGLIPTLGPIRLAAAFNESPDSSSRASVTRRIALSRNSCEYFLGAGMTDPSANQSLTFSWAESVRMLRQGVSPGEVARRLRVTRVSVNRWWRAVAEGGLTALESKGPGGAHCRLDRSQLLILEALLDLGPT